MHLPDTSHAEQGYGRHERDAATASSAANAHAMRLAGVALGQLHAEARRGPVGCWAAADAGDG